MYTLFLENSLQNANNFYNNNKTELNFSKLLEFTYQTNTCKNKNKKTKNKRKTNKKR